MAAPAQVHASKRRGLEVAAGLAVVALVFTYFLPKIANYGQVWSVVSTLSWPWIRPAWPQLVAVRLAD
jgi:hypothetical protein